MFLPEERPRVMAYVSDRCTPPLEFTPRTDLVSDLDLQLIEFRQGTARSVFVLNIYNAPEPDSRDASTRLLHTLRDLHMPDNNPLVLTGDWNLHHSWWELARMPPLNDHTEAIVDFLNDAGFTLLNEPDAATFVGYNHNVATTIDLTMCNVEASANDVVKNWRIDSDGPIKTDHLPIVFNINQGATPIETTPQCRLNWKKTDVSKFRRILQESTHAKHEDFSLPYTSDQALEQAAAALAECLEKAAVESTPIRLRLTSRK